jgi:type II secretory ATPase GspE/PulE/Tfp pilus assembly ATPase PilB-like protein
MPTKFGEKVVMRILDAEMNVVDLKSIISHQKVRQIFTEMVFRPNGLVLVTGPTGSGKTTTMYAGLMARRRPELNLVTVEDPIEYHLDGTTQIQVQPEVGTTFDKVLRALLRQDPDVIMVGETRDAETARMAVEASMTGHLVITSLHANGALESVLRLLELQVDRYTLANTLLGVLHQRLVRRCCPNCTEPFEYPAPIVERLYRAGAFLPHEKPTLSRGKGCPKCNNTGFKGRVAMLELLIANDAVKAAISSGGDTAALKEVAKQGAMVDLARYAGILVGTGVTVPGEVLHMLQQVGG